MNLEDAKTLISTCIREELRDHALGDSEVFWVLGEGEEKKVVAEGYFGSGNASVSIEVGDNYVSFKNDEARELRDCGIVGRVDRNDETGPDTYTEGKVAPGLTTQDVFRELTGE